MEFLAEAGSQHAKMGCYRCSQPSPVIDLDILIEGEGVLCLCRNCILEAANVAMVTPRSDPLHTELARINAEMAENRVLMTEVETVVTTLFEAHRRLQKRREKEREAAADE